MSIYTPPSMFQFVPRHKVFSMWTEHIPFGYDLVAALEPSLIVELGASRGMSFFGFCQSMVEHNLIGEAYAIDTWEGDEHGGYYGDEIYQLVADHAKEFYPDFTHLLRMTFNEAAPSFSEETIELLHIDGLHTYEAVREDFENWYPKVKPGGIILFHDIYARMTGFGVGKYWRELSPQYTSFEFRNGFGLGVIRKPGGPKLDAPLFQLMFSESQEDQAAVRGLYAHIARSLTLKARADQASGGQTNHHQKSIPQKLVRALPQNVKQQIRRKASGISNIFSRVARAVDSSTQPQTQKKKAA